MCEYFQIFTRMDSLCSHCIPSYSHVKFNIHVGMKKKWNAIHTFVAILKCNVDSSNTCMKFHYSYMFHTCIWRIHITFEMATKCMNSVSLFFHSYMNMEFHMWIRWNTMWTERIHTCEYLKIFTHFFGLNSQRNEPVDSRNPCMNTASLHEYEIWHVNTILYNVNT